MEITQIPWDESVWFADVDDTLISTELASPHGSEGVKESLIAVCGADKAAEIESGFNATFDLMVAGYRVVGDDWSAVPGGKSAFEGLLEQVTNLQPTVKEEYGHIKKWSREIFVYLAAQQAGVELSPESIHEAADAYWMNLTRHAVVFDDATELAQMIADNGRPLYLATSSDARLRMQDDGTFVYDPKVSEALKRERLEILRHNGLQFNAISIGDPEDKPDISFFEKAVRIAEDDLGPIALENAIMLGDSFAGDLQTPKEQMGFGLVVLRKHGMEEHEVNDARQITTGNLVHATKYLS